jgi:hypothetical protein
MARIRTIVFARTGSSRASGFRPACACRAWRRRPCRLRPPARRGAHAPGHRRADAAAPASRRPACADRSGTLAAARSEDGSCRTLNGRLSYTWSRVPSLTGQELTPTLSQSFTNITTRNQTSSAFSRGTAIELPPRAKIRTSSTDVRLPAAPGVDRHPLGQRGALLARSTSEPFDPFRRLDGEPCAGSQP